MARADWIRSLAMDVHAPRRAVAHAGEAHRDQLVQLPVRLDGADRDNRSTGYTHVRLHAAPAAPRPAACGLSIALDANLCARVHGAPHFPFEC